MKKLAFLLVVSVLVPSLVLAWLAVRSLRDQEYVLQRQQSVIYQALADNLAREVQAQLENAARDFNLQVLGLLTNTDVRAVSATFDRELRNRWPLAQIGFVVNRVGALACPSPAAGPEASLFCANYGTFLTCRESAEVYWSNGKQTIVANAEMLANNAQPQSQPTKDGVNDYGNQGQNLANVYDLKGKAPMQRKVVPQQQQQIIASQGSQQDQQAAYSKFAASEAEFCQLTSSATEGTLARFVDNKLSVLFWCRPAQQPTYVFGAQVSIPKLAQLFTTTLAQADGNLQQEVCIAVLDDNAKPTGVQPAGFQANWKRPFVASEIGEALPHWEVAVYLLDPARMERSAQTLRLTLGLLIGIMVAVIVVGSWVVMSDLNRQVRLARQKTDFVSNVSHELKTPLTSIRMFSELLAEGRVTDPAKQRSYLGIITAEASRLTRLINNVLDFARMERNEKKYEFQTYDLGSLVTDVADTFRPHLEANGFKFTTHAPTTSASVRCDRDAIAQVIVNLLSNAEKYSGEKKEIELKLAMGNGKAEVQVLDRGLGVPPGCEGRIFEQFYRAQDSLSSGIQGTGLGLTLARQVARAHSGDVFYTAREGGGSCFTLELPLANA